MLREAYEEADKKLNSNINMVRSSIYKILVDMIFLHQTRKVLYNNVQPFLYKGNQYMSSPDEAFIVHFLDFLRQYHQHHYQDLKTSLEKEQIHLSENIISLPSLPHDVTISQNDCSQELLCLTITIPSDQHG